MTDTRTTDAQFPDGLEVFVGSASGEDIEYVLCARCGGDTQWADCPNCDEFGYSHHNCGEDSCCCLYPENNVVCDWCGGTGGRLHCANTPAWCAANPLPGREGVQSTAMSAEAWDDD